MKQENKYFWVGGKNTVIEIIKNKKRSIKKILYLNKNILKNLPKNIEVKLSNVNEFNKIFKNQDFVHQGLVAYVEKTKTYNDKQIEKLAKNENVLMLDNINDPRNIGSMIRSAAAFDVRNIIIEKNLNIDSHYLFKSASGATEYVNFIKVSNLNNAIKLLKKNNFYIYATSLNSNFYLDKIDFHTKNCLILGSESKGIKKLILKNSDIVFKIRQSSKIDSLNVSNSAAIILSTLYKKRAQ